MCSIYIRSTCTEYHLLEEHTFFGLSATHHHFGYKLQLPGTSTVLRLPGSTLTSPRIIFRFNMSSERKPGVATASDLQEFIAAAAAAGSDRLLIADVRNPNFDEEPGDAKSVALSPLPTLETRPLAHLLTYDRTTDTMPIPDVDKDTYIITHCGAGSR